MTPDIHGRCRQQIAAHLTSENVLNWILDCEDMLKNLETCRWDVIDVDNLVRDVLDSAHCYIMDHFASLIASDSFLSLGHGEKSTIARLENLLLRTAAGLSADQACRSYPRAVRLNQLLTAKVILPNPMSNDSLQTMDRLSSNIQLRKEDEALGWHEDFVGLVSALMTAIEQNLIRQCSKAMRCSSWQRMDADLRSKMQKLACLSDTDDLRKLRSSASSAASVRNYSVSSSISSRSNDLRQVKLAIQAHNRKIHGGYENSNIPVIKRTAPKSNTNTNYPVTKASTRTNIPEKMQTHKRSHSEETSVSTRSGKFLEVKSRYMDQKKPKTPLLDNRASNRLRVKTMSSSESSTRGSSPAFNRRQAVQVKKASNLSLDSLQSPMKLKQPINSNKKAADNSEISIDSLAGSIKNYSNESLVKKGRNLTDETKLKKKVNSTTTTQAVTSVNGHKTNTSANKTQNNNNQTRTSFLSQKSREILAKRGQKERKHSTNSNSSLATTKSTDTSPRMNEINKSSSSASILSRKKVYSTTLHLRKTATLSDASESSRRDFSKSQQSNTNSNANAKSIKSTTAKKPKTVNKVDYNKDKKSTKQSSSNNNNNHKTAPLARPEDEEVITSKMARSNTFSKETSDNPLELLKIMN
jgi:BTB/POZ domain-containing protein 8